MIKAFGKLVTREKAYEIIVNDIIAEAVFARSTWHLEEILYDGWKKLDDWTDKELEEYIDMLLEENQPGGKI